MADNKSCEGKVTTLECLICGYREVFTERQFKLTDGLRCNRCDSPVQPSITRPGEKINNRRIKTQSTKAHLSAKMDFSESIKGLKAIQREARKATAALKELDHIKRRTCPNCGLISLNVSRLFANEEVVAASKQCKECGWTS